MCETQWFYIFLANSCLTMRRAPNKIWHVDFVLVSAGTGLSSKRGPSFFCTKSRLFRERDWLSSETSGGKNNLSFFLSLHFTSLFLPHFFLLGAYIWKAVYSSTEMSRLEVQGKRICEYFVGNFHTYKIEHSGQCYKYRYYRVCLNPCSF